MTGFSRTMRNGLRRPVRGKRMEGFEKRAAIEVEREARGPLLVEDVPVVDPADYQALPLRRRNVADKSRYQLDA